MAIYRLEAKIIGRGKSGRSVVAAAAYRAGKNLCNERDGRTHYYARRSKGVTETVVLTPEGAPSWATDLETLWNKVEASEVRVDAQLAREIVLALPRELAAHEQRELALGWVREKLVSAGMVAQVSLHRDRAEKNPHAHILCTLRKLNGEEFSKKKVREWNSKKLLLAQRESWADAMNAALEKAGRPERVSHLSLKERGIDRLPMPKKGVAATAMEKRGAVKDSENAKHIRFVRMLNQVLPFMRAIESTGEVRQVGMGNSWWERSLIFMSRAAETAREAAKDTWRWATLPSQRGTRDQGTSREPELSR